MTRRYILGVILGLVMVAGAAPTAKAGGYTVYIYNMNNPSQGWFRSGFDKDTYVSSWTTCYQSIKSRVAENQRYRTDFEAFAILYTPSRPPYGSLSNYRGQFQYWIVYIPRNQWYY